MMVIVIPAAHQEYGDGTVFIVLVLLGLVPLVTVVSILKTVIARYVMLTSIGAFRNENVVHHVIERSQARMAMNVMRVFDWLILLKTKHEVSKPSGPQQSSVPGDAELVMRVFERIGTTAKPDRNGRPIEVITEQAFAAWYRKSKVLSDQHIGKEAIRRIFEQLSGDEGCLSFTQFTRMFLAREEARNLCEKSTSVLAFHCQQMQVAHPVMLWPQAELRVFGKAKNVVQSVFPKACQDGFLYVKDFKAKISDELGANLSDAVVVELFEEVGFVPGDDPNILEQKVSVHGLVQLLVKYAPNYPTLKP